MAGGSAKDRRRRERQTQMRAAKAPQEKATSSGPDAQSKRFEPVVDSQPMRAGKSVPKIFSQTFRNAWFWVSVFVTVIGLPNTIDYYLPKVVLTAGSSMFPNNPFYTRFELTNSGNVDLHQVRVMCGGLDLRALHPEDTETSQLVTTFNVVRGVNRNFRIEHFSTGSTETFSCDLGLFAGGENIEHNLQLNGRILFTIDFDSSFWPTKMYRHFVFKAFVDATGHTVWTKQPLTDAEEKTLLDNDKAGEREVTLQVP